MQAKAKTTTKNENLIQGEFMTEQEQDKLNLNFFRQINRDEDKAIRYLQKGANPFYLTNGHAINYIMRENKKKIVQHLIENHEGVKEFIQDNQLTQLSSSFMLEPSQKAETLTYLIKEAGIKLNDEIKEHYRNGKLHRWDGTEIQQADLDFTKQLLAFDEKRTLNEQLTEKLLSNEVQPFSMEKPKQGLSKKMKSQGMKI